MYKVATTQGVLRYCLHVTNSSMQSHADWQQELEVQKIWKKMWSMSAESMPEWDV